MMKAFSRLVFALILATVVFSCSDESTIGSSLMPEQDKISVYFDTVRVGSRTIQLDMDSVYLRNEIAVLGEYTDAQYGTVKSDYMAQLYCPIKFSIPDDVKQIDSAYFYLYYDSYFGDSSNVLHLNVYELDKEPVLTTNRYYSNTDVSTYCSFNKKLTSGSFTTADFESSDSVKALSSYVSMVRMPLDLDRANQFLTDYRSHPEYFATPEAFRNYMKGIYVTTDFGNGSMLYITKTELELCYDTWLYSSTMELRDSLVVGASYFPVTKEVKQINRVSHPDLRSYLSTNDGDSLNYVYAPGGLFTEVIIPDTVFKPGSGLLSGRIVNGLQLVLSATQVDSDDPYAMEPPSDLLLIDASKIKNFFEGFNVNDGLYSFLAEYDESNDEYVFDLSRYAQEMVHEMDDPSNTDIEPFTRMLVVPVKSVQNDDDETIRLEHLITPAAVKVKSSKHPDEPMKLRVVASKN